VTTPKDIAELRRLEGALAAGPWKTNDEGSTVSTVELGRFATTIYSPALARFIVGARNILPGLLAEVERLQSAEYVLTEAGRLLQAAGASTEHAGGFALRSEADFARFEGVTLFEAYSKLMEARRVG
jgi:hypothetical protein